MANTVKLEIMTPSKLFYRGEVDLVIVTTTEGEEGFMAGHSCVQDPGHRRDVDT